MDYKIETLDTMTLLGKGETFKMTTDVQQNLANLWGIYNKDGILNELMSLNDGNLKGLIGLNTNMNEGSFDYIICTHATKSNEKYNSYEIEKNTYAVFPFTMDKIGETWNYVHTNGVSGYEIAYNAPMLEVYKDEENGLLYIPIKG